MSHSGTATSHKHRPRYISRSLAAAAALATTSALALSVSSPASAQTAEIFGTDNPDVIDNQFMVVLNDTPGTSEENITGTAELIAGKYDGTINHIYSNALQGFSVEMNAAEAEKVAALPEVDFVEAVYEVEADTTTQSNPPNWGLDRIDQQSLPLDDEYTYPSSGGSGVTVYVMDTGIRTTHQEFGSRASTGPNFTGDGVDNGDCQGHGTHVAGSVAGAQYGVAKSADVVSLKVLACNGRGSLDGIIAAIDWVTDNASGPSIVNMSLGGNSSSGDQAYEAAINASINAGVTYVAAAGNDGANACNYSPARFENVITVGNSNSNDSRHISHPGPSNFGPCVDIFGPGTDILSATHQNNTGVVSFTGTSMAAPHVAGVAALYLGENPNASPAQVENALLSNAVSGALSNIGQGSPNLLLNSQFLLNGDDDNDNGDTPPVEGCDGYQHTESGSLQAGNWHFLPGSQGYFYASAGTHEACLETANGGFRLYLEYWNGSSWTIVASGEDSLTYQGPAGHYSYVVAATNGGSGAYTLGFSTP
ncbi:S8 family peptidase [Natronoglycomyces albus]|uniref:S8 family peptidase n=1 Tax=Natronoglycomyces albus TaxID=2811108 RepID=A0A895XKI7_9ACTN|nr:S8 family peptidase [Natronoglycomyces albus]QSB04073.1 S8 family peptidase [Natronoglycomyces albus]